MPTKRLEKHMLFFDDHDDQDQSDLTYGGQKEACKKLAKRKSSEFTDASFSGDWKPETD